MYTEWLFEDKTVLEIDPAVVGFVYIITNLIDGRKYYGKKNCWFKKTNIKTVTQKNGIKKKKKIRSLIPSDWPEYYGSSEELKKDVVSLGKENFKREILQYCTSLSKMSYHEARYQFIADVLLKPDEYYNSWISVRTRRDHLLKK